MTTDPTTPDQNRDPAHTIRTNLEAVAARVAKAAQESRYVQAKSTTTSAPGLEPNTTPPVQILLATKTQPAEKIRVALEHGFTLIGENRVQELNDKFQALADIPHETHLIGPLQRNKVNHTLGEASCIQSIDNLKLATKIQARLEVLDSTIEYFVQVNTSRENTKSGVAPEALTELLTQLRSLDRMRIRGLMTIGLPGDTAEEIRPSYAELRTLRDTHLDSGLLPPHATELSMGMSHDFELAISEGATMVRLGSSIFGARR